MAVLTFLFTDIENSTHLWETYPEAMQAALQQHDLLLRGACEANGAQFVKSTGDGMLAVFLSAAQAGQMSIEVQRSLAQAAWGETGPIRVRIGMHSGEAEQRQGDYFGQPLNRAARVMALANGGQILLSNITASLLQENLPQGCQIIDLGAHRLKNLERPERIYQLTADGLEQEFPPLRSLGLQPNNLPVQMTSFVGRESEIAQLQDLLGKSRLITLTGPGGTGKTRLSLQAAAEVIENYPDGVWLVELAPLTDPSLIPEEIASIWRIPEQPGRPMTDVIIDFLHYKSCLLILDNCEHLIDACAILAEKLLRACPKLTILASSRESLGVSGEMILRVPPLSLPAIPPRDSSGEIEDVCRLQEFEAVQLFVERAQAASTGFHLDPTNASPVAQICRRLDGIPLALELAAARIRLLPAAQIAERLDDRFRLLTGGSRTALPRQQTLQALIEWSWDLLEDSEKSLLRRLSVFAGGFSLEAVEAVCALDSAETWTLLDCLDDLVNKSLVIAGEEAGKARFYMLETIRQFARDRLREVGEGAQVRDRHRDYFTRYAEEESIGILGSEMLQSLDNLDLEYENIRLALEWGVENQWEGVAKLAGSLVFYWETHSVKKSDGRYWLKAAIQLSMEKFFPEAPDLPRRQAELAWLLAGQATMVLNEVDHARAVEISEQASDLARQSGDKRVLAYALSVFCITASMNGEVERTVQASEEAIRISHELNDSYLLGRSLLAGRYMALAFGGKDNDRAIALGKELREISRQTQNPFLLAMGSYQLGIMEMAINRDYDSARKYLRTSINSFSTIQNRFMEIVARSNLAHLERRAGHIAEAARIYQQTLPRWLEAGNLSPLAHQFECLAYLCLTCQEDILAARLLGFAGRLREGFSNPRMPDEVTEHRSAMDRLRATLSGAELEAAIAEGQTLEMEAAMKLADQTFEKIIQHTCA